MQSNLALQKLEKSVGQAINTSWKEIKNPNNVEHYEAGALSFLKDNPHHLFWLKSCYDKLVHASSNDLTALTLSTAFTD